MPVGYILGMLVVDVGYGAGRAVGLSRVALKRFNFDSEHDLVVFAGALCAEIWLSLDDMLALLSLRERLSLERKEDVDSKHSF